MYTIQFFTALYKIISDRFPNRETVGYLFDNMIKLKILWYKCVSLLTYRIVYFRSICFGCQLRNFFMNKISLPYFYSIFIFYYFIMIFNSKSIKLYYSCVRKSVYICFIPFLTAHDLYFKFSINISFFLIFYCRFSFQFSIATNYEFVNYEYRVLLYYK